MQTYLREYFDYKPLLTLDEVDNFFEKEVKKPAIEYLGENAGNILQKTYDFAKKAHASDKRLSGEPYIVHPVWTAKYLLMIKPDIVALQTALLHDVIEDTSVTSDEIKDIFGSQIAFLCLGLEKVSKVRYHGEDRQLETLKKTFLAMGQDIRVIFVKLADRIHNIQTLRYHPKREKQIRIANETLKIYAPIAKRLGIEVFQLYLENGAFAILNPDEFNRIFSYLEKTYSKVSIDKLIIKLEKILKQNNIDYLNIKGRLKSPYRIFLKFEKYNTKNIDEIKDILAFRVIVKDIPSCYYTLGVIHSKYTPVINRIKDYISLPKANGYQSLHTTILGFYKTPVEIQIRTQQMDDFAEYGIAAHFLYKEKVKNIENASKQIQWVNKLKDLVEKYKESSSENRGLFNILAVEFLRKSIFVYTPKGNIIELPKGATVLDFAFKIHTDLGLKFKSALVNGKIVPIDYKLRNGDIIEIKAFKEKYTVKREWLDYVISPTSKGKIRQFLNSQERENYIGLGKEILNHYLKKYSLPLLLTPGDKISKQYSENKLNSILVQIAKKSFNVIKFLQEVYGKRIIKENTKHVNYVDNISKEVIKDKVLIEDSLFFKYNFCLECKPKVGDRIIGKVGKDGVKIHKTTCKALRKINFQKLVEAYWLGEDKKPYDIEVIFDIKGLENNIAQIINLINHFNIKIFSIHTEDKESLLKIGLKIKLPATLYLINKKLETIEGLYNHFKIIFK